MKIIYKTFAELDSITIDEEFNKIDKCKISGEILSINIISEDANAKNVCSNSLKFNLENNREIYSSQWTGLCTIDSYYYGFGDELPSKGDSIYAIIDKENNQMLKYGKSDYDKHSEIPVCETESSLDYYFYGFGIVVLIILVIFLSKLKYGNKNKS